MIDLLSFLKEYKTLTQQLLDCIEKDNFDELKGILDKREEIINFIDEHKPEPEELEIIANQLDIISLQNKLDQIMNEKKKDLLGKINGINKNKLANQNYYKKNYTDSLLLNKKI